MFAWLARAFLTRRAIAFVSRRIPNPFLRALGIAAAGAAVTSLVGGRRRGRRFR